MVHVRVAWRPRRAPQLPIPLGLHVGHGATVAGAVAFGPLITPDELAGLDSPPTLLDVRWDVGTGADRAAYLQAHLPGGVFVDLDRQLSDPPSERGRHPLPDAERFGAEMRALGVDQGRPVVVYDAATSMAAARAW